MKKQLNEIKRMQELAGILKENFASDTIRRSIKGFKADETAAALDQVGIKYKVIDNIFVITRPDGETAEIGDGGYGGYAIYSSDNEINQERSDQTIEDVMDALKPWFGSSTRK